MEYLHLNHKEIRAYQVSASQSVSEGLVHYTLSYPELDRTLTISFASKFPHAIAGWTESIGRRSGGDTEIQTSRARRIQSIKTAYWRRNRNSDLILRDSLGLPKV
jgi:hypothetical protein